jgi:hypothetical protein
MHIRTAWDDFFPGTNSTNLNSQTYTSRQTPSGTNVYVLNCLFRSIFAEGEGGALCCTSVTYLLIESTSFVSCKTSSNIGGAIYNTGSGQCVLYGVCGFDCCSTYTSRSDGQFARIYVNNGLTSKNYINYSSIARCVNENSNSHHMLQLEYGKICCPSVNLSMNKCYWYTGITCRPYKDSNSVTCSLSYSSFTDIISSGYACILIWTSDAQYEIKCCNVLRNNVDATIWTNGNVMIEDSCILENNANRIFYQSSSSCTINLLNCTIDSTSNNQNLIVQKTVTKSFILALNHLSLGSCHSEYDSVGTLTPNIQSSSSSNKQIPCFTHGNLLSQSQIREFVSLLSVFLFNFIHLDASINPLY